MKKKSIIEKIIALLAGVLLAVLISYLTLEVVMPKEGPQIEQFTIGEKPDVEKLNLTMPDMESLEARIAFAVSLYEIANQNYKDTENVALMIHSTTKMFGGMVTVPGYRYVLKNDDEYYYLEYSFIPPSTDLYGSIVSGLAGAIAKESTEFALRKYYDPTMDKIKVQRVITPTPLVIYNEETRTNTYDVDWTNVLDEEEDIPIYYSGQTQPYVQTEQIIDLDTVMSAEISYNEEEGYYTLVLELDPDTSTAITLPKLRAGANNNNAHYTTLTQTIEIWDNGYFRYFRAEDNWAALMGGVMNMSSEIDFRTYFYYDEYWTNINNYQYMKELKSTLGN